MSPFDLWAMLAGPSGFLWLQVLGDSLYLPVAAAGRFVRVVEAASYDGELQVGASTSEPNPWWSDDPNDRRVRPRYIDGASNVLWVRAETPTAREAVEHFSPAPTLVLGEGASHTALWALQQPLSPTWTVALNRRLAHKLGTKKGHAELSFRFAPAGAVLRAGRARPVVVDVVACEGELHSARAVAGNLEDPPDPRAAWRARQAA